MITGSSAIDDLADDEWRIEPLLEAARPSTARVRGGALPPPLARRYGTELAIALRRDRPSVVANFVSTLDGVVAFDTLGETGGREVSGGFMPDRFLMGLLRATADAVLVGAGTVRSGNRHVWTPGHVHPPSTAAFAAWRRQLGLAPQPTTVIVTASGRIDPGHPGVSRPDVPVLVVTTTTGADRLGRLELPPAVEVAVADDGAGDAVVGGDGIDVAAMVSILARRGHGLIVCEGGPTLFGSLVVAGLVDELFLTVAPHVAGRAPAMPRLGLVEGRGFEIGATPWAELGSVMRAGSHLFLRYRLTGPSRHLGAHA